MITINGGNSLDNREIEHFFDVMKTEFINHLNINEITFEELEIKITKSFKYYNSFRIQEKLVWKAPDLIK